MSHFKSCKKCSKAFRTNQKFSKICIDCKLKNAKKQEWSKKNIKEEEEKCRTLRIKIPSELHKLSPTRIYILGYQKGLEKKQDEGE